MSDEKVPDDAERDPKVGLWCQADEWLGRRHRVHLMWMSFLTGLGVFWLAQTVVFNPLSKDALGREYSRLSAQANHYNMGRLLSNKSARGLLTRPTSDRTIWCLQ